MPVPRIRKTPFAAAHLPCLLLGLFLHPVLASGAEDSSVTLRIKPSICVSYNSDAPCTMGMRIDWQADRELDVCLHEDQQEAALHCWSQARSGELELAYADTRDVVYQLIETLTATVLASADVTVINRDLRSSRKRRRHVWSIL